MPEGSPQEAPREDSREFEGQPATGAAQGAEPARRQPLMRGRREVEFKLQLRGEADFETLLGRIEGGPSEVPAALLQVNHFFDTAGESLACAGQALRLRVEGEGQGEHHLLTAKGPALAGHERTLTVRPEEELAISRAQGEAVLAGELDPLALLSAAPAGESSDLLASMRERVAGQRLRELGSFRNWRARTGPLTLAFGGEPLALVFELDKSEYPDGSVAYELEVELEQALAERARAALRALFEAAGLEWSSAPSKAQRFRAALGARQDRAPDAR